MKSFLAGTLVGGAVALAGLQCAGVSVLRGSSIQGTLPTTCNAAVTVIANGSRVGRGFVVATARGPVVVTARHLVMPKDDEIAGPVPVQVLFRDGVVRAGTVRAAGHAHNLAFVDVGAVPNVTPVVISTAPVANGQWLAMFPPSARARVGRVVVVEKDWGRATAPGPTEPVDLILARFEAGPLEAGGALMDASGRAVGVVLGAPAPGVAAAVALAPLAALIESIDVDNPREEPPRRPART